MTNNDIGPIRLPDELISVTPHMEPEFTYRRVNGHDVIAVMINDNRVGHIEVLFTPSAAQYTAAHLGAMVADLDNLRRQWHDRNRKD